MEAINQELDVKTNVAALARDSLLEAKGDRTLAAEIMQTKIKANKELLLELTEPFISRAVWQKISVAAGQLRLEWVKQSNADNSSGLTALANRNAASILDSWCLSTDKPLGDATPEDLEHEAMMHERLSASNAQKSRFYRVLIGKMGNAKTVRKAFTAKAVEAIVRETIHD